MRRYRLKILKKIILFTTIVLVQVGLVYGYLANEDLLFNIKLVYIKEIYIPIYKSKLKHLTSNHSLQAEPNKQSSGENARSIPVLLYHGIVDRDDGANVLISDFKEQMYALKKAGYQTVRISDFYDFVAGKKQLPEKSFLLTFDDGRKDSYYPVDPILKDLNYNAVMYVITDNLERKTKSQYYLSRQELKNMALSGRWELQPHTKSGHGMVDIDSSGRKGHFFSNKMWLGERLETDTEFKARIKNDFVEAKCDLQSHINTKAISFAFPFGDYGQESINYPEAADVVVKTAKHIYPIGLYRVNIGRDEICNYPGEDQFLFKRISIRPHWTAEHVVGVLEAGRDKNLPFQDAFTTYQGWVKRFGQMELNQDGMRLKSSGGNGASVFLGGSKLWRDYKLKAKLKAVKGQAIVLMRYEDDLNFVAVHLSNQIAYIEQVINGKRQVLKKSACNLSSMDNLKLQIIINGKRLSFLLDDKLIVESNEIHDSLASGGVGLEVWNREPGNNELLISHISIEGIKVKQ